MSNNEVIMENLSGPWNGELSGTNSGRMNISLQHEGNRIYGEGSFHEPALGEYKYQIQGISENDNLNLILTPISKSHLGIQLGTIEADATLDNSGKIIGKWNSSIGTSGTFFVERTLSKKKQTNQKQAKSVFIVHGHDDATKEKVARFLERLDLEAIILHEQVNKGMTIIEKFEEHSKRAGFAVVLFTPDDVAYPLGEEEKKQPRARQNVVLEMGYFIGLLGRNNVSVLYKGEVELPSDILGVVYTRIDSSDSWKLYLAKELKTAGYSVDLNKLM